MHRTYTQYENSASYIGTLINSGTLWWHQVGGLYGGPEWSGPHIFTLAKNTTVYASDDTTRVARMEYQYDQQTASQLQATPGVTQHTTAPDQRGNLTSVKRYTKAEPPDDSTAITDTRLRRVRQPHQSIRLLLPVDDLSIHVKHPVRLARNHYPRSRNRSIKAEHHDCGL
ncbi:MAG: hypothetical protein ABI977_18885 [Acidobacteriota bacterium]